MALRRLQLLLDLQDALVQVVHQVLLLRVRGLTLGLCLEFVVRVLDLLLEILDLLLVLLDNFLAEVRSFGELFFDLFVILEVLAQVSYNALHLVVAEHEVFCALRLVVQLRSQLHILDHGEFGRALQLVLISHRVLHPHRPNLHQHVLAQLVNLLDPVFFNACDQSIVSGLLLNDLHVVEFAFLFHLILIVDEVLQVSLMLRILRDLLLLLLNLRVIQRFQRLDFVVYIGSSTEENKVSQQILRVAASTGRPSLVASSTRQTYRRLPFAALSFQWPLFSSQATLPSPSSRSFDSSNCARGQA